MTAYALQPTVSPAIVDMIDQLTSQLTREYIDRDRRRAEEQSKGVVKKAYFTVESPSKCLTEWDCILKKGHDYGYNNGKCVSLSDLIWSIHTLEIDNMRVEYTTERRRRWVKEVAWDIIKPDGISFYLHTMIS